MTALIAVIGAGLSGLHTAVRLEAAGHRVLLIEARERVGGRVLSRGVAPGGHRADLGPSWYWPSMNPRLSQLLVDLGLSHFAQYAQGATAVELNDGRIHRQNHSREVSPSSYRISGGTKSLIEALQARLGPLVTWRLSTQLTGMRLLPDGLELTLEDLQGVHTLTVSHAVLTLPPRVQAQDLHMEPAWPEVLTRHMHQTPTWMAGQAKFVAIYDKPFWREAGWSGAAMSQRGPMVEIYDASDAQGHSAALFGFIGLPYDYRKGAGKEELSRLCLTQFARLFGEAAKAPLWCGVQDWAQEPYTATAQDQRPLNHHPLYDKGAVPAPWLLRLWLAGTERSPNYGGYLEGALEASDIAVRDLLKTLDTSPTLAQA